MKYLITIVFTLYVTLSFAQVTVTAEGGSPSYLPSHGSVGVKLTVSHPGVFVSNLWYKRINGTDTQVSSGNPVTVFTAGDYLAKVTYTSGGSTYYAVASNVYTVYAESPTPKNKTVSTVMLHAGIKSEDDLLLPYTSSHGINSITYSDGLGRPVQNVQCQASPGKIDMVQPILYNKTTGRIDTSYLPYTQSNTGNFHANAISEQKSFYSTSGQKRAVSTAANAVTVYEDSPYGTVLQQGGVGTEYQIADGKTTKYTYRTNAANEVAAWTYNPATTGASGTTFIPAGALTVKEVTNAENQVSLEYADINGRIRLRKYLSGPGAVQSADIKYTYYVYDEKGRLVYEVPYLAITRMGPQASWSFTNNSLVCLGAMHYYQYDNLDRAWYHRAPGAGAVYVVYDRMNRPVLSQNAEQRTASQKKWSIVKYDRLSRTILTGLITDYNATMKTHAEIQALVNAGQGLWEERQAGTPHGYSNDKSLTWATASNNFSFEILNVNYYDDYNFDFDPQRTNDVTPAASAIPVAADLNVTGKLSGHKSAVIGMSGSYGKWIWNVPFYDEMGRTVQTRSNSHVPAYPAPVVLNTLLTNSITLSLNFTGQVVQSENSHVNGSTSIIIKNRFVYDHAGRLLQEYQQNNTDAEVLIKELKYNELGQPIEKNLHKKAPQTTFLQSIDYTYNIQGRLTHINNPKLAPGSGSNNDDSNDLFGLQLFYENIDSAFSGLPSGALNKPVPRFDSKISAVKWRTNDANNVSSSKDYMFYTYKYSKRNEYNSASLSSKTSTGSWAAQSKNQESVYYDAGGNTNGVYRYNQDGQFYEDTEINADFNKITAINQNAGYPGGILSTGYTYNSNGNLITDSGKRLTFEYNHMDLVSRITWKENLNDIKGTAQYIYSADGTMVQKLVTNYSTGNSTSTHYIDGFCYEGAGLKFFAFSEGRVVNKGTAASPVLDYEYTITDHQGYTRINFTDNNGAAKVFQENHFYPSGVRWGGSTWPSGADKFMLQGKEFQDEAYNGTSLAWYDFGARMYDPAVMRWWAQDPVYQYDSPYVYCGNDPINRFDPNGMDDTLTGKSSATGINYGEASDPRQTPTQRELALQQIRSYLQQSGDQLDIGLFRDVLQFEFGISAKDFWRILSDDEVKLRMMDRAEAEKVVLDPNAGPSQGGNTPPGHESNSASIYNEGNLYFANVLKDHYSDGGGEKFRMTPERFNDIHSDAVKNNAIQWNKATLKDGIYKVPVNFYKSSKYDLAFGRATMFFNEKKEAVGFYDYWDLDPKAWGVRSPANEGITRFFNSTLNGKNFDVTYGVWK